MPAGIVMLTILDVQDVGDPQTDEHEKTLTLETAGGVRFTVSLIDRDIAEKPVFHPYQVIVSVACRS